jgi:cystathionine beta-lyase
MSTWNDNVRAVINEKHKMILGRNTNKSLMKLADIAAIAKFTKEHNIMFAVDNTFATTIFAKTI